MKSAKVKPCQVCHAPLSVEYSAEMVLHAQGQESVVSSIPAHLCRRCRTNLIQTIVDFTQGVQNAQSAD